MSKLKKVLLLTTAYLLVVVLAIGGTLAYLTSEDSDVNVMTLGNVKIEQIEQQKGENGALEPFKQAKGIYPGTEVSKIVSVKNTGKSDAYFRTLIAFEYLPDSDTFGVDFSIGESYRWSQGAPEAIIEIDGVTYQVYEACYNGILKAGETAPASLTKVEFAKTATNEDMKALGGTYEILVLSQAVQTEGFDNALTALESAFGKTSQNAAEWFGGMGIAAVSSPEELKNALTKGKSVILLDDIVIDNAMTITEVADINLNGHTLATVGIDFQNSATVENGEIVSAGNTKMVPHLKISSGTLTMDNVTVVVDDYLNTQTNGSRSYAEYTGMEIKDATAVLNNCSIQVKNDVYRTWNYVYGITMTNAELTMNGGSIVVESAGASIESLETAISGIENCTATFNNVDVSAKTYGTTMGRLIVNTTDANVSDSDFVSYGGTYVLNKIS